MLVGLALARGERPGGLALAGAAIALAAAVLASVHEFAGAPAARSSVLLAGAAALAQNLLGERVSRPHAAGIALALIGVGIVSVN